ncbi:anti-sigma factor [Micrococcus terreus]|uniref:anti-sigma factor n=1 Tax=Micrococcus terreus TaxID=574650 RepID=UPI0023F7B807|nr:anti-sigma factor [Micrococcus terreus]
MTNGNENENENVIGAELLAAWALDAVDENERRPIEQQLGSDSELRARADALNSTVARLAVSTPAEPPAGLRDRVLSAVAGTGQDARPAADGDASPAAGHGTTGSSADGSSAGTERAGVADLHDHRARRRPAARRWWVGAVSAAAAAAVAVAVVVSQPWAPTGGVTEGDQLTAIEQILQVDGAERLESPVTGGGEVEVARVPTGETVLAARGLPAPGEGRDYQMWTIQGEAAPQPAGLLEVQNGLALVRMQDVPADAALAVTVEPAGGSEAPTTDPIVVLASS